MSGNQLSTVDRLSPLSQQDRDLCLRFVVQGNGAFDELNWTVSQRDEFLGRSPVTRELERLRQEFLEREDGQERVRWLAQRQVNKMVPSAMNVLARAMMGMEGQSKDSTGNQLLPPTPAQYFAALEIMRLATIGARNYTGADRLPEFANRKNTTAAPDGSDMESTRTRERLRVFHEIVRVEMTYESGPLPEDLRTVTQIPSENAVPTAPVVARPKRSQKPADTRQPENGRKSKERRPSPEPGVF